MMEEKNKIINLNVILTIIRIRSKERQRKNVSVDFPLGRLVAVTGVENWGFHGINFHWGTSRNYTWNEIVGYLHVIQNDEIDYMRSLSYANFKTK